MCGAEIGHAIVVKNLRALIVGMNVIGMLRWNDYTAYVCNNFKKQELGEQL